jgi:hypothetical protein
VLADAEAIVNEAAPDVVAELESEQPTKSSWWRRGKKRRGDDGEDFRLSSR